MNSWSGIGRWAKENELRYSQNGKAVLKNTIAIDRKYGEGVNFFDVVMFGKTAENTANYTSKGRKVGITGRLQQDTWETQEGQKRSRVVIIADEVEFLEYGDKYATSNNGNSEVDLSEFEVLESDEDLIPF